MNKFKCIAILSSLIFSAVVASQAVYEDLTVTATKKESSLMDTAAAINAVSGDNLFKKGINDISGLRQIAPDLVLAGEGKSRVNVRIRGIGTYQFDPGADPASAIVIDGVAQPRVASYLQNLMDIERIEVLKGPQGAIYGANALGGIVNIVTRRPEGGDSGRLAIKAGNNGQQDISLRIDTDISDTTSARIALARGSDDGQAFEEATGRDNGVNSIASRFSLFGENNGVVWNASLAHNKMNQDAVVSQQNFLCNSTNPQTHSLIVSSSAAINGDFCTTLYTGASTTTRGVINTANPIVQKAMASDDSQELNIPGYNYAESILFTFGSESYIGENKLTTVFGATQINSGEARDFDATSLDALQQFHQAKTDTTTLEMRLDSDSSAKYPWTVGVYGMRDHGFRLDTFATGPQSIFAGLSRALSVSAISSTNITMASSYADILAALNACVTNDNCGAFIAPPSPANATGTLRSTVMPARANIDAIDVNNFVLAQTDYWRSNARMELKTQSTAVFGNVTIPLREDLSLFLGGRYSVLDKPYNYIGSTNAPGAPLVVAPFTTNSGTTLKEFDPKITLQKTYDNALGWVTYTTASKSGGPGFAQWSAADASKPYAAEELEMIELGYKAVLNDGATQVEAILYTYDYTDHQQILVGTNAAGNPAGVVVNGDATINGIELSYRTYLNENTNLALSYAGIDAEWDKFMDPRTDPFTDRAGEKMAFAPDNSINLALENVQYLNIGELTSAISIVYKDKYKLALVDWEPTTVDDLTLVNLTVGLDTPSGWNISAFCNNCTDDEYKMVALSGVRAQGGGNRYGFGDGRRIGLQLSTDF